MGRQLPIHGERSAVDHITAGLAKIAMALRGQAWEGGAVQKLTPTQGHILTLLADRAGQAMRLNDVARELCLTAATVSDAVMTLVEKRLAKKKRSPDDQRALVITLTVAGRLAAQGAMGWTDVVRDGVTHLTPDEQAVFLRGLTKVIGSLQAQGVISVVRMCAGCTYFQAYRYADAVRPHHCGLVNKAMGEGQLRLDCTDFIPGSEAEQGRGWQTFLRGKGA